MTIRTLIKNIILCLLSATLLFAQSSDDTDAIEKARQAKEAAEKAAAEAAAATEAAIEAAATKAAKAAREEAKKRKEEEEARKLAEAQAAEEAELDAAASAAAEAAKRKMAEELGLEYESESEDDNTVEEETRADESTTVSGEEVMADEVIAKESTGWNIGAAASVGLVSGATFTSVPTGATIVISTPYGFKLGPFDYNISVAFGGYSGQYDSSEDSDYSLPVGSIHWVDEFNPSLVGLGGNLTLSNFIFAEGHLGNVGQGLGFRGFAGITLERLMKNSMKLPFNLLVGSEAFYSSDMAGSGNASGWASIGLRLDYGL